MSLAFLVYIPKKKREKAKAQFVLFSHTIAESVCQPTFNEFLPGYGPDIYKSTVC